MSGANCGGGGGCGGCTAWLTSIGSAITAGHCGTSTGFAHGVLTHGGCTSDSDTSNSGTRLTQGVMAQWLDNFINGATFVDFAAVSGSQLGTALSPARTIPTGASLTPSGGTMVIAGGTYSAAAGNTGTITTALTMRAVSGNVVIGQ